MDVIKIEQDNICDTNGICLNKNCNFVGIQQGAESDVKTGFQLNAASWGDLTVVKSEVQHITVKAESVLQMKEEIQPTEECHLRVNDDIHCVLTKQKDKPVVKNGACLISPQGKGPSHPAREEHSIGMFKVEPDSFDSTSPLYSPNDDPLIDVKQEKCDVTIMENMMKVEFAPVKNEMKDEFWALKEEFKDEITVEEHEMCLQNMGLLANEGEHTAGTIVEVINGKRKIDVLLEQRVNCYKCPECSEQFSRRVCLSRHIKTHIDEGPYKCDICHKGFAQAMNLGVHRRAHAEKRSYNCKICNKGFIRSGNLAKHCCAHTGEESYVCELCGKGFTNCGELLRHRRTHAGENPYTCDICKNVFSRHANLTIHMRIHTGEKPYICDICSKGFRKSGDLARHRRTHTGEKPYICDICNKGFVCNVDLTRHRRTHTGEKPYACGICKKAHSRQSNLVRHMRIHIPEKTINL
ncbi:hypothetical protein B7P43_G10308 [Cryptotermes secundus]|nr:putative zinc finger protein 286B isoform X1 [Cryptotermes secundus]XP_023724139.1 putative zinc finger protein 286B isoform X1 [Cryptotermes secundus]XP_023724140.1 putative zinc finger protein 286B isoform X1 [Cryptotermes secundus]XP_023724141.1 putative zinc finger protein 286B isoform X1 [Cryptotermes secundus]XP_023724142.1 putative zinc finger protein 286B isoform X1 [Cryptotermes secundus]PNF16432.1 hypothetical protein B7P43_G10308 [Cryptotermes secundus]PNF16434.1 hypothetical pr